jgi:hypothetical protein
MDNIDKLKAAIGDQLITALRPKLDAINAELSRMGEIGWGNIGKSLMDNLSVVTETLSDAAYIAGQIIGIQLANGLRASWNHMTSQGPQLFGVPLREMFEKTMSKEQLDKMFPDKPFHEFALDKDGTSALFKEMGEIFSAGYEKIVADAQTHSGNMQDMRTSHDEYMSQFEGDVNPFVKTEEKLEEDAEKLTIAEAMMNEHLAEVERQAQKMRDMNVADVEIQRWKTEQTKKYLKQDSATRIKVTTDILGSLSDLAGQMKGMALVEAGLQVKKAIVNTYSAANAAIAAPPTGYGPTPLGYSAMAAAIAQGLANVMKIKNNMKSFAEGGSFITSGPEAIMVGDNPSGREMVNVVPLDAGADDMASTPLNITITGNVMSEDYTEDVIIPQLKNALRRGEDIGIG